VSWVQILSSAPEERSSGTRNFNTPFNKWYGGGQKVLRYSVRESNPALVRVKHLY
jgi:hypothetical protein